MGDHHVPRHGASTADILPLARQCLRGSPCVAAARFQRDRVLHQRLGAQRDTHLPRPTGGVPVPASLRTLVGRAQTAWLTQQRFAQLGVPRSRVGDRRQPARPHHHADDRLFLVRPRVAAAREARPLRDGGPAGRTAGEPAQRFDVDSDARHRHVARRVRRRGARAAGDGSASAPARPVGDRSRRAAQGARRCARRQRADRADADAARATRDAPRLLGGLDLHFPARDLGRVTPCSIAEETRAREVLFYPPRHAAPCRYPWFVAVPVCAVLALILLKADDMAIRLGEPFGSGRHDLPLEGVCATCEVVLLEIATRASAKDPLPSTW
mmetsp:Transcript_20436/g.66668  ORF Transcript_20436/g.66668 Transcript_20436/m.66668 type:complete len:326 (+) Transcript_20436:190-1167(+)